MKFLYEKNAGSEFIKLENEAFLHLKARRVKQGERIELRNLIDDKLYLYEVQEIGRKNANLSLEFASLTQGKIYDKALAWAVVDPKTIEKTLAFLNELGLGKIIFVYTKFSQANFKLDLQRFKYLCAMSCQQCGRQSLMKFEVCKNIDEFLELYPNSALLNFGGKSLQKYNDELLFVGPEGGFSDDEVAKFKNSYSLNTSEILRSQTAMITLCANFVL
ncbi:MAG: 16S rRNA (uracil(1498)-N(3))-methyltransferase [Campylobacter sp.]|nr:16S rRNA (uracil(1498)-N(3))-methyltransferase [Campylobacter sp.]